MGGRKAVAATQVAACLTDGLAQCRLRAKSGQCGLCEKSAQKGGKAGYAVKLYRSSELFLSCGWQGDFHPISRGAGA